MPQSTYRRLRTYRTLRGVHWPLYSYQSERSHGKGHSRCGRAHGPSSQCYMLLKCFRMEGTSTALKIRTCIYKPQSAERNEIQSVASLFIPPAIHDQYPDRAVSLALYNATRCTHITGRINRARPLDAAARTSKAENKLVCAHAR
jgi:hypothetical protein